MTIAFYSIDREDFLSHNERQIEILCRISTDKDPPVLTDNKQIPACNINRLKRKWIESSAWQGICVE